MLEPLAPENERDPYPCQSPKTLPGIASLSPDKHPALPHPQLHQTQPCDISPETPYDTAIPLHYGSYEYTRSREYFTPQGAGNKSHRDSNDGPQISQAGGYLEACKWRATGRRKRARISIRKAQRQRSFLTLQTFPTAN